ncbi:hypothetical protein NC653_011600 [Populus alba x Populus x berolinensis]|uniref:Uncharacterized protein n=1 Tax=Populus alba x Populus x berolinensis TaxID=444605 RepID=A0AAD6R2Q9_9ROSI|nr:hypothetical protein NC653_011600 [Populus alba x Populus x berolinensis]
MDSKGIKKPANCSKSTSLSQEELTKIYGRDAISDLIAMESDAETESDNDEETTLSEQNQTADSRMLLEVRR